MKYNCTYIPYSNTHCFSDIVIDYVNNNEELQPFYNYAATLNNIEKAIEFKKENFNNRQQLVDYFNSIYPAATAQQRLNIGNLQHDSCFTICSAHQPNIFLGPLYFIYKILHTIKMAQELNEQFVQYKFVPVFFIGSEDADLDELNNITIQQKKLVWTTTQTGAVGRMKVDEKFRALITEIENQIAVNEFGKELATIFKECYATNQTIAVSTFKLINTLFGKYGLLVLLPDAAIIKSLFSTTIEKELVEQFSAKEVAVTTTELQQQYNNIKPIGRPINLFYLIDNKRERIVIENGKYVVENLGVEFTQAEIMEELKNHPERFSPNVVLRPSLQETILPNVVFIGGGGEIAYWLQQKSVFTKANISYPILVLRNSFLLYTTHQQKQLKNMGLSIADVFESAETLLTKYVKQHTQLNLSLANEIAALQNIYAQIASTAAKADSTLAIHTQTLANKATQKLQALEKKMLQAEKRKFITQKNQLQNIKNQLFFNNNLQERIENFSYYFSKYGFGFFDTILQCSNSFTQQFGLIEVE